MDWGVYKWALMRLSFQFDPEVATSILPSPQGFIVEYSRRGMPRYVFKGDRHYLTLKPSDGLFTISIEAGEAIVGASEYPRYRVVVSGLSGGSVFAHNVVDMDPRLRPGDEVVVVNEADEVIGTGRLKIPLVMLKGLARGEVVRVRHRRG